MTTKAALVLDVPRASSEAWARPKTLPLILAAVGIAKGPVETLKSGHFYVPQPADVITRISRDWEEVKAGF